MEIDKYLASSEKVAIDDLDWDLARKSGLTSDEVFILTYFADIEGQTIIYMRDLLHTSTAFNPEVIGFLAMWNYEEYFHGRALSQFLENCGYPLDLYQIEKVRKNSRFSEKVEALLSSLLSKVFATQFPAVYMAWGAMQEFTTLRGYEQIARTTQNPVLKTLVERIAKQERRHFAWYFNSARDLLQNDPFARSLTRFLMLHFWSPVGAGVKSKEEVLKLVMTLFPEGSTGAVIDEIDKKISTLPGLDKLTLMSTFIDKIPRTIPFDSMGI